MSPREEAATVAAALAHQASYPAPTTAPLALVAAVPVPARRGARWHLHNLIAEALGWLGERSMRGAS